MVSSITRQEVVTPVTKTVYMIISQTLVPNNKIITNSRYYSTAARQHLSKTSPFLASHSLHRIVSMTKGHSSGSRPAGLVAFQSSTSE
jgi:hypothetical protein